LRYFARYIFTVLLSISRRRTQTFAGNSLFLPARPARAKALRAVKNTVSRLDYGF
jgi:hypothetical protein